MRNNIFLKISKFFHKWSKGWLILLLFFIMVFIFITTFSILNHFYPDASKMQSLDDPVFHMPEEIFSIIESWGEVGRVQQLWFHLTWDFVIPILGFFIIGLTISWLTQRSFNSKSKMQKINLIAFASIFDLLENICLEIMLIIYPSKIISLAWFKTIFTMTKYVLAGIIIIVVLISLVKAVKNKFKVIR
jgi:hypothetical protein